MITAQVYSSRLQLKFTAQEISGSSSSLQLKLASPSARRVYCDFACVCNPGCNHTRLLKPRSQPDSALQAAPSQASQDPSEGPLCVCTSPHDSSIWQSVPRATRCVDRSLMMTVSVMSAMPRSRWVAKYIDVCHAISTFARSA